MRGGDEVFTSATVMAYGSRKVVVCLQELADPALKRTGQNII